MLKKSLFLLFFLPTFLLKAQKKDSVLQHYMNEIHKDSIMQHLIILASDEYEGRGTFEAGNIKAMEYLMRQYLVHHLQMLGNVREKRHYAQPFVLKKGNFSECFFIANEKRYESINDFLPCNIFEQGGEAHDLVFAGLGRADSAYNYFTKTNITGKWVAILLENTPKDAHKASSSIQAKARLAKQNGAKGVFFIQRDADTYRLNKETLVMHESKYEIREIVETQLSFPIFTFKQKTIAEIFKIKNKVFGKFLDSVATQKNTKIQPLATNIKIFTTTNKEQHKAVNIIGCIEGTDLRSEAIIVSAHFDHLGKKEGTIYNGANDNASGTSTLLEMLRILDKMRREGYKPRRTIIFAAFTAEEYGLWGSKFYTQYPLFPLENTKFNVNIDMVGVYKWKNKKKRIDIAVVEDENPIFRAQQKKLVESYQLNLDIDYSYSDKNHSMNLFYRSDHYNFAKKGIPIAFFNNMNDRDYHQPTDDIKNIEPDAMQEVAKLILATIWTEANKP